MCVLKKFSYFFSNYTSITVTGGGSTIDPSLINAGGNALTIGVLNARDALVVTFTAGVANCTLTALPLFFGAGQPTGRKRRCLLFKFILFCYIYNNNK